MKRVLRICLKSVLVLLVLLMIAFLLVQLESVQTFLGQKAGNYLSRELNAEVSVKRVNIDLWDLIHLEEVLVRDQERDTLIFVNDLNTSTFSIDTKKKYILLNDVVLTEPKFHLDINQGDSVNNLEFILNYFRKESSSDDLWVVSIPNVELINGSFQYFDYNFADSLNNTLNSKRLGFKNITGNLTNLEIIGDSISSGIPNLAFRELGGLTAKKLSTKLNISPRVISLMNTELETPNSKINGNFVMKSEDFKSYSDYVNSIDQSFDITEAQINLKDFESVIPQQQLETLDLTLSGKLTGKLNRLKAKDVTFSMGKVTEFTGSFNIKGLPDVNAAYLDISIDKVKTNKSDLEHVILPVFVKDFKSLPENIGRLGDFSYSGDLIGYVNDFVTFGVLNTAIGNLSTDIKFKEIGGPAQYAYTGELSTKHFDLGQLYSRDNIGALSSSITVKGSGIQRDEAILDIEGEIEKFELGGNKFENITLAGTLEDNFFSGEILSRSPSLDFDFTGDVDFRNDLAEYKFSSVINKLDIAKLTGEDIKIDYLSTELTLNGKGNSFDDISGIAELQNTEIFYNDEIYSIKTLSLTSTGTSDQRTIDLTSDILDGSINGAFSLKEIVNSGERVIEQFSNGVSSDPSIGYGNFSMEANIKDLDPIKTLLPKGLEVAENTQITMSADDNSTRFTINGQSAAYEQYGISDMDLSYIQIGEELIIEAKADQFVVDESFIIKELNLNSESRDSTLASQFSWNNGDSLTSGTINFDFLKLDSAHKIDISNGDFLLGIKQWNLNRGGVTYSVDNELSIDSISISSGEELVFINGSLNDNSNTEFRVENLDLSAVNFFTTSGTADLRGIADGFVNVRDNFKDGKAESEFRISNLTLDNTVVGDVESFGEWKSEDRAFYLSGKIVKDEYKPLSFNGNYYPFEKEEQLDFKIQAEELQLNFLEVFVKTAVSGFAGTLSGEVDVKGKLKEPQLNGHLDFNNAQVTIDYLNTTYYLQDGVDIRPDMFILENTYVQDENGNKGNVIGTILHNNYRGWSYDILLDVEKNPFLCLNTTESQNDLFYGKAYATGYVNIGGFADNLEISANLSSEKGTTISMPLGNSEDVAFENFVTFVKPETGTGLSALEQLQEEFNLRLDLEIDVTEEAEFQLIFDQVTGDVLKGSGQGHVSLVVNSNDEFSMYGNVEVVEGEYLFTLQNLINKAFIIKPGGSISWYGDPFLADINLQALYGLSAPLYDLLGDGDEAYKKRIPVDLVMNLNGKLLNPGIGFEIELPTADEITENRVNSIISTEQEMNRQAFSLLVLKKFMNTNNTASAHGSGIAENSTEFIASQLNSWLSQITDEVNIGINYRPGDEITNQEIALALSTQLFQDKVSLSGNFGMTSGSNPNTIIGDVRIEVVLFDNSNIRLLVYNESNNFDINTTNYQTTATQGVGLIYREDFDSWDEFTTNVRNLFIFK